MADKTDADKFADTVRDFETKKEALTKTITEFLTAIDAQSDPALKSYGTTRLTEALATAKQPANQRGGKQTAAAGSN